MSDEFQIDDPIAARASAAATLLANINPLFPLEHPATKVAVEILEAVRDSIRSAPKANVTALKGGKTT